MMKPSIIRENMRSKSSVRSRSFLLSRRDSGGDNAKAKSGTPWDGAGHGSSISPTKKSSKGIVKRIVKKFKQQSSNKREIDEPNAKAVSSSLVETGRGRTSTKAATTMISSMDSFQAFSESALGGDEFEPTMATTWVSVGESVFPPTLATIQLPTIARIESPFFVAEEKMDETQHQLVQNDGNSFRSDDNFQSFAAAFPVAENDNKDNHYLCSPMPGLDTDHGEEDEVDNEDDDDSGDLFFSTRSFTPSATKGFSGSPFPEAVTTMFQTRMQDPTTLPASLVEPSYTPKSVSTTQEPSSDFAITEFSRSDDEFSASPMFFTPQKQDQLVVSSDQTRLIDSASSPGPAQSPSPSTNSVSSPSQSPVAEFSNGVDTMFFPPGTDTLVSSEEEDSQQNYAPLDETMEEETADESFQVNITVDTSDFGAEKENDNNKAADFTNDSAETDSNGPDVPRTWSEIDANGRVLVNSADDGDGDVSGDADQIKISLERRDYESYSDFETEKYEATVATVDSSVKGDITLSQEYEQGPAEAPASAEDEIDDDVDVMANDHDHLAWYLETPISFDFDFKANFPVDGTDDAPIIERCESEGAGDLSTNLDTPPVDSMDDLVPRPASSASTSSFKKMEQDKKESHHPVCSSNVTEATWETADFSVSASESWASPITSLEFVIKTKSKARLPRFQVENDVPPPDIPEEASVSNSNLRGGEAESPQSTRQPSAGDLSFEKFATTSYIPTADTASFDSAVGLNISTDTGHTSNGSSAYDSRWHRCIASPERQMLQRHVLASFKRIESPIGIATEAEEDRFECSSAASSGYEPDSYDSVGASDSKKDYYFPSAGVEDYGIKHKRRSFSKPVSSFAYVVEDTIEAEMERIPEEKGEDEDEDEEEEEDDDDEVTSAGEVSTEDSSSSNSSTDDASYPESPNDDEAVSECAESHAASDGSNNLVDQSAGTDSDTKTIVSANTWTARNYVKSRMRKKGTGKKISKGIGKRIPFFKRSNAVVEDFISEQGPLPAAGHVEDIADEEVFQQDTDYTASDGDEKSDSHELPAMTLANSSVKGATTQVADSFPGESFDSDYRDQSDMVASTGSNQDNLKEELLPDENLASVSIDSEPLPYALLRGYDQYAPTCLTDCHSYGGSVDRSYETSVDRSNGTSVADPDDLEDLETSSAGLTPVPANDSFTRKPLLGGDVAGNDDSVSVEEVDPKQQSFEVIKLGDLMLDDTASFGTSTHSVLIGKDNSFDCRDQQYMIPETNSIVEESSVACVILKAKKGSAPSTPSSVVVRDDVTFSVHYHNCNEQPRIIPMSKTFASESSEDHDSINHCGGDSVSRTLFPPTTTSSSLAHPLPSVEELMPMKEFVPDQEVTAGLVHDTLNSRQKKARKHGTAPRAYQYNGSNSACRNRLPFEENDEQATEFLSYEYTLETYGMFHHDTAHFTPCKDVKIPAVAKLPDSLVDEPLEGSPNAVDEFCRYAEF